jgi:lipoate-protein ligase B
VAAAAGVEGAHFRADHPGLWCGSDKLASIGIHVSRGVTVQGLSLNLEVDPSWFDSLVSCGLRGVRPRSLSDLAERGRLPTLGQAARLWAEDFAAACGLGLAWDGTPPC